MITKKQSLKELTDIIENAVIPCDKREDWIILWQGKRIVLQNGKCVWGDKNHAKAALTNKVKYPFERKLRQAYNIGYLEIREHYRSLLQQLIDDGTIQFVNLRSNNYDIHTSGTGYQQVFRGGRY